MALVMLMTLAITYPIFLRTLGPKLYGLWLLMATVLNIAQMSSLGLGPALARAVAHDHARGLLPALGKHWISSILLLCVSGALMTAAIFILRSPIVNLLRIDADLVPQTQLLMPIVSAIATLMLVVEATGGVLIGVGRSDLNSYSQAAAQTVAALLPIALIQAGFGIMSFPIAILIAYTLAEILLIFLLNRHVNIRQMSPMRPSVASVKELMQIGTALSGSSVVQLVLMSSTRVLLARYAGLTAIPVYDLAYNGSLRLRNVIETGLRAMMPEISRLRAKLEAANLGEIRQLYKKVLWFTLSAGTLIYAAVAIGCGIALKVWLGRSYSEDFHLALEMGLLGTYLSLIGVPAYYTLMGLGLGWPLFTEKALHTVVQLTLIAIAVPISGQLTSTSVLATGAAGMGISSIYLLWRAHRATRARKPDSFVLSCGVEPLREQA